MGQAAAVHLFTILIPHLINRSHLCPEFRAQQRRTAVWSGETRSWRLMARLWRELLMKRLLASWKGPKEPSHSLCYHKHTQTHTIVNIFIHLHQKTEIVTRYTHLVSFLAKGELTLAVSHNYVIVFICESIHTEIMKLITQRRSEHCDLWMPMRGKCERRLHSSTVQSFNYVKHSVSLDSGVMLFIHSMLKLLWRRRCEILGVWFESVKLTEL